MNRCLLFLLFPLLTFSQGSFGQNLFESYESFKEKSLSTRRFKHRDLEPLIEDLDTTSGFTVTPLGYSIQGRSISMISAGEGEIDVLLWSQMHGDESTATMALFDIFNYLRENKEILNRIKVHFIPMLNPDGAELFTRRNAIGIDINRDAIRLQSPESQILKGVRDSLDADFGFNLHDQSRYYNAEKTAKPATLSFLAPAFNEAKDMNEKRENAMKIIAVMNEVVQEHAPGQVARYSDTFEPRAFGDNMQKWGTSTILIESGGYPGDPEKQIIRKLNFIAILSALKSISEGSYRLLPVKGYWEIPRNDRSLFDLKIEKITFPYLGREYMVDLGIVYDEVENNSHTDFYYVGKVADIGDLSTHFGYKSISAEGLSFKTGETYPKIIPDFESFRELDIPQLLKDGYTSVSIDDLPEEILFIDYPINIIDIRKIQIPKNNQLPKPPVGLEKNPTFLLTRNEQVVFAVINGFVYAMEGDKNEVKNGLVE
jgi:hypothetical protein